MDRIFGLDQLADIDRIGNRIVPGDGVPGGSVDRAAATGELGGACDDSDPEGFEAWRDWGVASDG